MRFRALFNSLHRFSPERVQAILRDAVERQEGIAVYEVSRRTVAPVVLTILMGLGAFLAMPFVRSFHPSLLLWACLPSCGLMEYPPALRAYTASELHGLCAFDVSEQYCAQRRITDRDYLLDWISARSVQMPKFAACTFQSALLAREARSRQGCSQKRSSWILAIMLGSILALRSYVSRPLLSCSISVNCV
jgi:hypothetical protein